MSGRKLFNCLICVYDASCAVCVLRDMAPGQHECDNAIEHLNITIRDLDQASLAAISQKLTPRDEKSLKVRGFKKFLVT